MGLKTVGKYLAYLHSNTVTIKLFTLKIGP